MNAVNAVNAVKIPGGQRGYNLVEIAIVLAVVLMMSSWLVTNHYEAQTDQRVNETEQTLEAIKDSIVDYAAANQIKSFTVFNGAAAVTIAWRVPAGRPYLPCPDITGDGLEDRIPLTAVAAAGVTLATGSYSSLSPGRCYRYKGIVPWRTLDVPRTDAWGNYFTYRVDPDFASSLLGFDQETTADDGTDIGDGNPPLTVTVNAAGATIAIRTDVKAPDTDAPAVNTAGDATVAALWGSNIASESAPSLICDAAPCSYRTRGTANTTVIVGFLAENTPATLKTGGYAYDLPVYTPFVFQNVVDGLPVVVLSHGQNGYGAVSGNTTSGTLYCNAMPAGTEAGREAERQNAFWTGGTGTLASQCPPISPTGGAGRQNGFVYRDWITEGGTLQGFDDVISWMTTGELTERLTQRGVFPAEKLPPVGLEGY